MATQFHPIRKKTFVEDHKIYNKREYYVDLRIKRNFLMLVIPERKRKEKKCRGRRKRVLAMQQRMWFESRVVRAFRYWYPVNS